jgi:hypothetical protein
LYRDIHDLIVFSIYYKNIALAIRAKTTVKALLYTAQALANRERIKENDPSIRPFAGRRVQ